MSPPVSRPLTSCGFPRRPSPPRQFPFAWVTASIRRRFSSPLRTPATPCASPDAYPADHVITLGDTDYPVPADGVITDPTLTATILSSREYTDFVRSARNSDGPVQLPVSWKLASPITVTVIPPASVIGDATNACVFASGTPVPVSIVSSQLGRTYVLPTTPLSAVDTAVEGRSCPSS